MLLLKNPQFLRNHCETWSKCETHKLLILTKFDNVYTKIVDLFKAYFWVSRILALDACNEALHLIVIILMNIKKYRNTI